jgi:hypothetical protein
MRRALLFPAADNGELHMAPSTLYKVYYPGRTRSTTRAERPPTATPRSLATCPRWRRAERVTDPQILADPTRCYVRGCDQENELMLHVADDPWMGGDYCLVHAREIVAATPLIMTASFPICARARRLF